MKIDPKSKSLFVLAFLFAACVPSKPQIVVQEMEIPESENSSLPRLYSDESGNVNLSFVRGDDEFAELYVSFFEGNSWTAPSLVSSGENWFVNWADFPSVITHDKNIIAAHWLQKTHDESPYAYAVKYRSEWKQ